VTGGAGRPQRMAKIVFDVSARGPKLTRQRRHRAEFVREQIEQLPSKGHGSQQLRELAALRLTLERHGGSDLRY
jgi:hypothetical protein